MAKPNTLLKRTSNALLDHVATLGGGMLGSDSALARQFDVSRTTVRAALERLIALGVLRREDDGVAIARAPVTADYFDDAETSGPQDQIELIFMQRVLLGDWRPGHVFSEAELARDSNASTVSVREFLIGFSRFGLIAKQPRGGWVLQEFHDGFAAEVADMRELIEMAAINRIPSGQDPDFATAADVMGSPYGVIRAQREVIGVMGTSITPQRKRRWKRLRALAQAQTEREQRSIVPGQGPESSGDGVAGE
jgi:DNA-binding GntR family transcriptional regulator